MKLVIYYFIIFSVCLVLYVGAIKSKEKGKKVIQYVCYFFLYLVFLFLV